MCIYTSTKMLYIIIINTESSIYTKAVCMTYQTFIYKVLKCPEVQSCVHRQVLFVLDRSK